MKQIQKCETCLKFHNTTIVNECSICNDLQFQENILCELVTAEMKENDGFKCSFFKPFLSVIGKRAKPEKVKTSQIKKQLNILQSNKAKWFKAYALQQLKLNPDQIHVKINYHVCLVSPKRENIFQYGKLSFEKMTHVLYDVGILFKSKISILGVAGDHIHLFIDSSPDYPADQIVKQLVEDLEGELLKNNPNLKKKFGRILERNYFIETVG